MAIWDVAVAIGVCWKVSCYQSVDPHGLAPWVNEIGQLHRTSTAMEDPHGRVDPGGCPPGSPTDSGLADFQHPARPVMVLHSVCYPSSIRSHGSDIRESLSCFPPTVPSPSARTGSRDPTRFPFPPRGSHGSSSPASLVLRSGATLTHVSLRFSVSLAKQYHAGFASSLLHPREPKGQAGSC